MSSSGFSSKTSSSARITGNTDPITRNALRYTISAKEYELLHQYLLSRAPLLKERAPLPRRPSEAGKPVDEYNAAAIRATLRVFVASYSTLKLWEVIAQRLAGGAPSRIKPKTSVWRSGNFRLSLSFSTILLFHRLLHRFLLRLRDSIRTEDARAFRRRNPRVARALTSKLAPAIGASLAGFFLGVSPADQTRITIAIYFFSRALEFLYNNLEDRGYFRARPWWFGSWLLMPVACGQLLHAFIFDRDCFPDSIGSFILKHSPEYIHPPPSDYPPTLTWPSAADVLNSLSEISRLKWPPFVSPILFPNTTTLPATVGKIAPITDPAHPAIARLSCALLHPNDPSCLRTHLTYYIRAFPSMAKLITLIYGGFALLRYRAFRDAPLAALNALAARILRTSFFLTSAIGTAWGSICLLQQVLPHSVLPTGRWFLSGFLAGMWAFLERASGRGNFLYSARLSLDSLWKVGRSRGWWRGVANGDVLLFVASLMVVNVVYERDPKAVSGAVVRKGLGMLRGEGWVDRVPKEEVKGREGRQIPDVVTKEVGSVTSSS